MNNLCKRIILAVIALPLLVVVIFLLPYFNNLCFNLIVLIFSVIGGIETRNLFFSRNVSLNYFKTGIISAIFPAYSILITLQIVPSNMAMGILTALLSVLFLREALIKDKNSIKTVMERLPAYCLILVFPGFFMSYLIKISLLQNSSFLIIIFLSMVFSNDTFAYLTGITLGGKNRGIFPVSPKKSLSGLLGGLIASGLVGFIFFKLNPDIFNNKPFFSIATGVLIGITSVIGDLFESSLKRSANEKDSGTIMAGRGGILDTIDSILFSAPLFYFIMTIIK